MLVACFSPLSSLPDLYARRRVVGGILSGSLALLADAGHMLTDAAARFSLRCWRFRISVVPDAVAPHFWLARKLTTGGFVNAIALVVITLLVSGKR